MSKNQSQVENEPSLWGLQTDRWQSLGSYGKKRIFWPKYGISGPKKHTLLAGHHVLAMTGKSCANKKVPFSKTYISLLANFGCFFGNKKNGFLAKTTLFGRTSKRPFLRKSGQDQAPCHSGSFFWWPRRFHQVLLKTVQNKGTYTSVVTQAQSGQKQGWAPKNDP